MARMPTLPRLPVPHPTLWAVVYFKTKAQLGTGNFSQCRIIPPLRCKSKRA